MKFYNRTREISDIVNMVKQTNEKNKIIVLYGTTGVGKSGLVRKLLGDELREINSIQVRVSKSSVDTIENLHYLNAIYKSICEFSKNNPLSNIPTPIKYGVLNIKQLVKFFYGIAKSKVGIEEDNRLFEPISTSEVIRKKDYIIEVLNKKEFIINVENIQNIDIQSLEIINEILSKISRTTFVFEYTIEEKNNENLMNFINELSGSETKVYHYEINKLNFEEARKLAPQYGTQVYNENTLENIYNQGNGNLMRIIMSSPSMSPNENPIKYSLKMLKSDESFILNLIYLNNGIINIVQLSQMILNNPNPDNFSFTYSYLLSILNKLTEYKVININRDVVTITHDSIIVELENQIINSILYSAYSLITHYYNIQKEKFPDDETNIESLFYLYLKFSDESIFHILDDLKKMIIKYKYPQNILSKLSLLKDKLLQKKNANPKTVYGIILMMLEVAYDLELMDTATEYLYIIFEPRNSLHLAYKAGILSMDSTNIESRRIIEELIIKTKKGSRLRLVMELCLLSALMQACPLFESKQFAEKMLQETNYQQFIEHGFILRNYAELVNLSESIKIYHECILFFEKFGRSDLQAQVYISLSMCHAYKGELETASNYLTKAVETTTQPLKDSFIMNNFAVIEMLSGNFNEQVVKNLNDALLITSNEYEAIIIKCNLLVFYIKTEQHNLAKQMCNAIEQYNFERFQYEEFLHIVYQNLLFYYNQYNDSKKNIYKKRIEELFLKGNLSIESKEYIKLLLEGKESEKYFYTKFPFRVDFLGYWGFEISRELEHFE